MDPAARIGDLVEGRYRVDRVVGRGGFGVVYEARHLVLDMRVALKVLALPDEMSAEAKLDRAARLMAEARLLSRLRHPNVVAAVDSGILPDAFGTTVEPYLVVEWCDGPTLKTWLSEHGNGGGTRSDLERAWTLVGPIASAIAAAHALGVVHRDLKPSNVMLARDGSALSPMLIDFGIAKTFATEETAGAGDTQTDAVFRPYTPAYAAPEQIAGARTGPWTDVHGLALLFTEIATGRAPYEGAEPGLAAIDPRRPTPARVGVDVGAFEPVLARALALRPADRFPDGGAFAAALAEAAAVEGLAPNASLAARAAGDARATTGGSTGDRAVDDRTAGPASVTVASSRKGTASAPANPDRRRLFVAGLVMALVAAGLVGGSFALRTTDGVPSAAVVPAPALAPLATLTLDAMLERVRPIAGVISTTELGELNVFYGPPQTPGVVSLSTYPVPPTADVPTRDRLRAGLIEALTRASAGPGQHVGIVFDGQTTLTVRDTDGVRLVRMLDAVSAGKRTDRREIIAPRTSDAPRAEAALTGLSAQALRDRAKAAGFVVDAETSSAALLAQLTLRTSGSETATLSLHRFTVDVETSSKEALAIAAMVGQPFAYARSQGTLVVLIAHGKIDAEASLGAVLTGMGAAVERGTPEKL